MVIKFVRYKEILVWLIFFLIVGIFQWKLGFINNKEMIGETDSFSRLSIIEDYINGGGFVLSPFVKLPLGGVWLSGYFSLFILFSKIGLGEFGFRIITWICGLSLTLLLWLIGGKLTKNFGGIWRMLILLVFIMSPLMLQVNLEMLAEPIAGFLLLLSLYFLLKEKNIWSIVFLFLSQSVRYEAWFMIPFYWAYIVMFTKNISNKNKILMFLGSCLFPLIWVILSFSQSGSIMNFYTIRQSYLSQPFMFQYGNVLTTLSGWTQRFQQYVSVEWFGLWIFGIVWIMVYGSEKQKWWGWMSIYSFIMVVLQLWLKSTEWFAPRFVYLVYVLSVPVLLIVSDDLKKIFEKTSLMGRIMLGFILIWLINQYIMGIPLVKNNVNYYFYPNQEIRILTEDLKREILSKNNDKVIFLWLKESPWLINDFNYYLKNRNGWRKAAEIKVDDDLMDMKSGDLVVVERGLLGEGKGFFKLSDYIIFEVWQKK